MILKKRNLNSAELLDVEHTLFEMLHIYTVLGNGH
jgi:hypothetical protein